MKTIKDLQELILRLEGQGIYLLELEISKEDFIACTKGATYSHFTVDGLYSKCRVYPRYVNETN